MTLPMKTWMSDESFKQEKMISLLLSVLKEGQKQGVFRKDLNAIVCAKLFFGAIDEMVTNWILSKKKYDLVPLADEVTKVFFGGILTAK